MTPEPNHLQQPVLAVARKDVATSPGISAFTEELRTQCARRHEDDRREDEEYGPAALEGVLERKQRRLRGVDGNRPETGDECRTHTGDERLEA